MMDYKQKKEQAGGRIRAGKVEGTNRRAEILQERVSRNIERKADTQEKSGMDRIQDVQELKPLWGMDRTTETQEPKPVWKMDKTKAAHGTRPLRGMDGTTEFPQEKALRDVDKNTVLPEKTVSLNAKGASNRKPNGLRRFMKKLSSVQGMLASTGLCLLIALSVLYIKASAGKLAADTESAAMENTLDRSFSVVEMKEKTPKKLTKGAEEEEKSEVLGVWLSFLDYKIGCSEQEFADYINEVMENCANLHATDVFVQVRPYADAMYSSKYYSWSKYASGTQGKAPGYDPLAYMVKAAHERNLKIHAWINPYRISTSNTNVNTLSADNKARKWANSSTSSVKRRVLSFNGNLYFNPARPAVQKLIINGVKELVENYEIDGIHMDDYFYPTLGDNYATLFDAKEYKTYVKKTKAAGETPVDIVSWRRNNVNTLVKGIYSAIKEIDPKVEYGISPEGTISNLYSEKGHYVDAALWMKEEGYVDYICPQIYWSFEQKYSPYKQVTDAWVAMKKNENVKLYIGLAAYRAGISKSEAQSLGDVSWSQTDKMLMEQVIYGRETEAVDGYLLFRYSNLVDKKTEDEMDNLMSVFE